MAQRLRHRMDKIEEALAAEREKRRKQVAEYQERRKL